MLIMWGPEGPPPICPSCGSFMLAKGRTQCVNCGMSTAEKELAAKQARQEAAHWASEVRRLRAILGEAMRIEREMLAKAREAEQVAARG